MKTLLAIAAAVLLAGCAATPKGEALPGGLGDHPPEMLTSKPAVAGRTGAIVDSEVLAEKLLAKDGSLVGLFTKGSGKESRTWKINGEHGTVYLRADAAHGSNGRWVLTDYRVLSAQEGMLLEARQADEEPAHWARTVLARPVALKRDPTDEAPEKLLKDRAVVDQVGTIKTITPTASSIASDSPETPDFTQSTTYRIEGEKGVAYGEARAEKKKGRWWLTGYVVYPPKVVTKLEGLRAGGMKPGS